MIRTALWLAMAMPAFAFADDAAPYTRGLLLATLRMEAVPQSPTIQSHLQLLHALIELDLAMGDAALHRLHEVHGTRTVNEMAQQLQLLAVVRLRQQGREGEAAALLARLPATMPPTLQRERQLQTALQLSQTGELGKAIVTLSELRNDSDFLSPVTLNLALLQAMAGKSGYALDILRLLGRSEAANAYEEEVRDRANLVLAQLLAQRGLSGAAQGALERIRLEGRDATAALLLLGRLRLELAGGEAAMVPWLELSLRNANDPAVIEGRLALAMALAQHAPDRAAHEGFSAAADFYQQRLRQLDTALARLAAPELDSEAEALGQSLGDGGSRRAEQLANQQTELRLVQQQLARPPADELYDTEQLRSELLHALQRAESALADNPAELAWRESYERLHRHLSEAFASERVRSDKQALSRTPFEREVTLLGEAAVLLGDAYRRELLRVLPLQQQRLAAYLEQCHFAMAKLQEAALMTPLEVP